jgi:hypothetical protein
MSDFKESLISGLKAAYKAYIKIYNIDFDFTGADFTRPSELFSRFSEVTKEGKYEVGAVQSLTITNERAGNVWRELDYTTAGRPVESYPGLPSYELQLDRIVLYDSMLTDAFYKDKDDSLDISKQTTPLLLQVQIKCIDDDKIPNLSSDQLLTRTWYLYDVWFLESSLDLGVDNTDDIKIVQSANALCAGIVGDK